jgi:hypothetical protein
LIIYLSYLKRTGQGTDIAGAYFPPFIETPSEMLALKTSGLAHCVWEMAQSGGGLI